MSTTLKIAVQKYVRQLAPGAISLVLVPGALYAQDSPEGNETKLEEVLVTGTQLRGTDPVGAVLLGMDAEAIAATGANTSSEILARIPQMNDFGSVPAVTGSNNIQLTVNRVNLRNLPQGVGSASPTLLLMNGRRMVGVGIQQNFPDPDVVPPDMLQRVEIITEGGSAIYGADAVGGVVNFITRRDFDGVSLGVKQGFGDDYDSTDATLTVGRDWGDTSAALSYNYAQHDSIYGRDRGYVKDIDWVTGVPRGRTCNPGNVTIGSDTWAINPASRTLAPGLANACDLSKNSTIYPEGERNSFFGGFRHAFNDRLLVELDAWYTKRENTSDEGPLEGNTTIANSNPNYISTGGATATTTQNVAFDFSPINGRSNDQDTNMETWGITPSLTLDVGYGWQMRAHYSYGYSETDYRQTEVNAVALGEEVAAGNIDPYNVVNSDPAAIARVFDWIQQGDSEQEMHNVKAVFDGPVFELPGGEIRLAVGAEYLDEYYKGATITDVGSASLPYVDTNRDVKAYFGEVSIPVVGDSNRLPGIYELTFSAAYRYDDYSDFGDADSPSYAVSWLPVEWLTLRARWNEAFQAPGLADLASASASVDVFPFVPGIIANPDVPSQPGQWIIVTQGTKLPLEPQTSENWNIGFDIEVPFVENLTIGASMYHIDYEGQISIPPVYNPGVFYPNYPDNYLMLPSNEEAAQFLLNANAPANLVADGIAEVGTNDLYAALDTRSQNLGEFVFEGYDFYLRYFFDTSFGSLWTDFNGTYIDQNTNQPTPTAPEIELAGVDATQFKYVWTFGTFIGDNISARATVNYVDEFDLSTPDELGEDKVDDWYTVDLYAQYDFPGTGWTEDLSVSLGATNVLDEDPPIYHGEFTGATTGYAGFTLGRVVTLGLNKKF